MQAPTDPLGALEARLDKQATVLLRPPRLPEIEAHSRRALRRVDCELALDLAVVALAGLGALLGWGAFSLLAFGLLPQLLFSAIHRFELTHDSLAAKTHRELLQQLAGRAMLERFFQGLWAMQCALLAGVYLYLGVSASDLGAGVFAVFFVLRLPLHLWRFSRNSGWRHFHAAERSLPTRVQA